MIRRLVLVVLAATCTTCVGTDPPHSSAQRIGALEETIGGPHAIGRVGDWLLQNDQVRFIVEDKGVGRVNTEFGGSLVDADLQRIGGKAAGDDELAELLPGFVFSVIDPVDVCVPVETTGLCPAAGVTDGLADGTDGRAAEVLVTGVAGDLLEMVALLNTGLVDPPALQMSQLYKLAPGDRYVTIETTIKNTSTGAVPFPYLNPTNLDALLGMNIPGISSIQLSAPLGQFPLLGGEQSLFVPGVGFNVRFGIEDTYGTGGGFPAFPGMVADFIASRGPGVSYGLAIPATPDNYVNSYASGYPGQTLTPFSMLLPFLYAGVTGAYLYKPPDQLNAGEQHTYESYFFVGRGDVGSVYDAILDQRGEPSGTFGGRVVDELSQLGIPDATVLVFDVTGTKILDELDTDAGGSFLGHLPAGMYRYLVLEDTRPDAATDPSGAITATPQPFAVAVGGQTGVFVEMHAPATIDVEVVDELGRHAPAKIQLIGHDAAIEGGGTPVDGRNILYSLARGERVRPTAFDGTDRYVENAWWTVDGRLEAHVKPGTYDLVASRGSEYELATTSISIAAGAYSAQLMQLPRSFDTPGWIAGDFHVHAQPSTDSGLPIPDRVTSCAAEGLEVAVATDHNFITDYAPVIANLNLDQWLLGVPGMELTTFEMGHFIGYPLKVDPGSTRGGEFVWAKQPPQTLFDQLRQLAIDPANSVVTVAHPRQAVLGYFAQFFIDAATAEPYTPTGIMGVFAPYGDEFAASNYSFDFDAIELVTGRRLEDVHTFVAPDPLPPGPFPDPQPVPGQIVVGADGRPQFPGVVETWMTMLDRGKEATGMGASDSHHTLTDEPGSARTYVWVGAGNDVPGGYTRDEVIAGIRGHHAIATTGPFIAMTVGTAMIGDTISMSGPVPVAIHVRAPSWAPVDHLKVYSNGGAVVADMAIPTGTDFSTTVTVAPPAGADMWIVAEATGDSNEFPVNSATEFPPLDVSVIIGALATGIDLSSLPIAAKLKPPPLHFSKPYAITNPIWVDTNGDGVWTPPQPPLPAKLEGDKRRPDVRARFDALPEWTP